MTLNVIATIIAVSNCTIKTPKVGISLSGFLSAGANGLQICRGEAPESVDIFELHERYVKVLSNERNTQYVALLGNTSLDAVYVTQLAGAYTGLMRNGTIIDRETVNALMMPHKIVSGVHKTEAEAYAEVQRKYNAELECAKQRYKQLSAVG